MSGWRGVSANHSQNEQHGSGPLVSRFPRSWGPTALLAWVGSQPIAKGLQQYLGQGSQTITRVDVEGKLLASLKPCEGDVTVRLVQDTETGVRRLTATGDHLTSCQPAPELVAAQSQLPEPLNGSSGHSARPSSAEAETSTVLANLELHGIDTVKLLRDPKTGVQCLTATADRITSCTITPELAAAQNPLVAQLAAGNRRSSVTLPLAQPGSQRQASNGTAGAHTGALETAADSPSSALNGPDMCLGHQSEPSPGAADWAPAHPSSRHADGGAERAQDHATEAEITSHDDAHQVTSDASPGEGPTPDAHEADRGARSCDEERIANVYRADGLLASLHVVVLVIMAQVAEEGKRFMRSVSAAIKGFFGACSRPGGVLVPFDACMAGTWQVALEGSKCWLAIMHACIKSFFVFPPLFAEEALALAKLPFHLIRVFLTNPIWLLTPDPYMKGLCAVLSPLRHNLRTACQLAGDGLHLVSWALHRLHGLPGLMMEALHWFTASMRSRGLFKTLGALAWKVFILFEEEAIDATVNVATAVAHAAHENRAELTHAVERAAEVTEQVAVRLAPALGPPLDALRHALLEAGVDAAQEVLHQAPRLTWALVLVWYNLVLYPLVSAFRNYAIYRTEGVPVVGPLVRGFMHLAYTAFDYLGRLFSAVNRIVKQTVTWDGLVTASFVLVPVLFGVLMLRYIG